jgi:hypothetical protein
LANPKLTLLNENIAELKKDIHDISMDGNTMLQKHQGEEYRLKTPSNPARFS